MVYLITYDLNNHDRDYPRMTEVIKSLGEYCHALKSVWLVDTDLSDAIAVYNSLKQALDNDPLILVAKLSDDFFGCLNKEALAWLEDRDL